MFDVIRLNQAACLRPWQLTDAPTLVKAWGDPDIAAWNAVPPDPTLATAERWIGGCAQRFERRLSVDAVVELAGGVVGEVGLSGLSDRHRGAFVGYWLLPEGRGRGLATMALQAFVEWAHTEVGLDQIVARCDESNTASHAVASRAGFRFERRDESNNQLWCSRTREK